MDATFHKCPEKSSCKFCPFSIERISICDDCAKFRRNRDITSSGSLHQELLLLPELPTDNFATTSILSTATFSEVFVLLQCNIDGAAKLPVFYKDDASKLMLA